MVGVMMYLLVEDQDMRLSGALEVELSERAQVTVAVKDLCLRSLGCRSCAGVPSRPYSARCRASEECV